MKMKETKYFICEKCGNLAELILASGVSMVCCGQKMTPLQAGAVEASHEKHIPVVSFNNEGVYVSVGSVIHPMSKEHSILWISLETDRGIYRRELSPDAAPEANFRLEDGERAVRAYAYCNLHGLWKKDV